MLHLLNCNVLLQESPATIPFTNYCCNYHADQMECIGPHTYFLNKPIIKIPTTEEANILNLNSTEKILTYTKLLKDGVIYCTASRLDRKRNSSFCSFCSLYNGKTQFGEIMLFAKTSPPKALLYESELTSLLNNAGPTCRSHLEVYKEVDILTEQSFVLKVQREHTQLIAVPIDHIMAKAMKIEIDKAQSYIISHLTSLNIISVLMSCGSYYKYRYLYILVLHCHYTTMTCQDFVCHGIQSRRSTTC